MRQLKTSLTQIDDLDQVLITFKKQVRQSSETNRPASGHT